jgi:glycosyl transferase family 25
MKSFIIRLRDNEHSCKIAKECVEQAEKFNLKVEYFDGVLGNAADGIFAADGIIQYPKKLKKSLPGIKGCAASHYLLWKKCIADNESYLILEHDSYMIRPLPKIDFEDILKLDPHNPFSETYERDIETDQELKILDYKNREYKPKLAPYGEYFLGAWAYIIKPAAAKILVGIIKEKGWVPADKQLGSDLLHLETTSSTIFRIHPLYNFKNIQSLSLTRNL